MTLIFHDQDIGHDCVLKFFRIRIQINLAVVWWVFGTVISYYRKSSGKSSSALLHLKLKDSKRFLKTLFWFLQNASQMSTSVKKALTVAMTTPHAQTPLEVTAVRVWMVSLETESNVKVRTHQYEVWVRWKFAKIALFLLFACWRIKLSFNWPRPLPRSSQWKLNAWKDLNSISDPLIQTRSGDLWPCSA